MRSFQPEYALIARETRAEDNKQLVEILNQIAIERAARLPPASRDSLEVQFQQSIRKTREDIQRQKDDQLTNVLRWLRG